MNFWFAVYVLCGLPIAFIHLHHRRQMSDSMMRLDREVGKAVFLAIVMTWPILLFTMAVSYLRGNPGAA